MRTLREKYFLVFVIKLHGKIIMVKSFIFIIIIAILLIIIIFTVLYIKNI